MNRKAESRVGEKYGRLKIVRIDHKEGNTVYVLCDCDCGKKKVIALKSIVSGATVSCGCYNKEQARKSKNIIHGMSRTRLYKIWCKMKSRCYDKNDIKKYSYYGGRGITVCEEWKNNFVNFQKWAEKNGYCDNLSIDRIDVNGNYEPSNCRWITMAEQQSNKRNNKKYGVQV